jgi:hypothetical protein
MNPSLISLPRIPALNTRQINVLKRNVRLNTNFSNDSISG